MVASIPMAAGVSGATRCLNIFCLSQSQKFSKKKKIHVDKSCSPTSSLSRALALSFAPEVRHHLQLLPVFPAIFYHHHIHPTSSPTPQPSSSTQTTHPGEFSRDSQNKDSLGLYPIAAVAMAGVVRKFVVASFFMWLTPVALLYGFNHNLFPGLTELSSESQTLLSGFLAVISVNIVIAFYICMAMREPAERHVPDPAFLAEAKASIRQSAAENNESSQDRDKQE